MVYQAVVDALCRYSHCIQLPAPWARKINIRRGGSNWDVTRKYKMLQLFLLLYITLPLSPFVRNHMAPRHIIALVVNIANKENLTEYARAYQKYFFLKNVCISNLIRLLLPHFYFF